MKVSVLILCWNYERYLEQCLTSVFNQTYQEDMEIIFLDNASTDNSFETAKALLEQSGFPYQALQNDQPQSVAININKLFDHSKGDYIFPFSADDWMAPTNITEKLQLLEANPETGLVFGGGWLYLEHLDKYIEIDSRNFKRGDMARNLLLDRTSYFHPGPAYSRVAIEAVGKWDENLLVEDLDFNLRLAMKYKIDFVPKSLIYYRRHASSFLSNFKLMEKGFAQYYEKYKSHANLPIREWLAVNYRNFSLEALDQREFAISRKYLLKSYKMAPNSLVLQTTFDYFRRLLATSRVLRNAWLPVKGLFKKNSAAGTPPSSK